ncbi:MAG: DUF2079 domain-containing protein [candidate division FCPU426 bacterium]
MFPPRLFLVYCLILAVSLGLAVFLARRVKFPALSHSLGALVVSGLALLHAWFYWLAYMTRHAQFAAGATDFSHFLQCLWKMSVGQAPVSTVLGTHLLRDHFSLLWYPVALWFKCFPNVSAIVLLSCLSVAAVAVALYWLTWEVTKSEWLGLAVGVSYLLNPYVQLAQLAAAHADSFNVLVIALSLLALAKRRWIWFYFLAIAAIAGKEEVGLYFGAVGLFLWLGMKEVKRGLALVVAGLASALLIRLWLMPQFGPDTQQLFVKYFSHLGGSPQGIVHTFATRPWMLVLPILQWDKLFPIFYLLAPTAFLSLLSGWALLPLAAAIWFKSIGNYPAMYNYWDHYSLHVMPFLYFACAWGMKCCLAEGGWGAKLAGKLKVGRMESFLAALLLALALLVNLESGDNPLGRKFYGQAHVLTAHQRAGKAILAAVPPQASVLTEENISPHLAFRPRLYLLHQWMPDPVEFARTHEMDYVVIDLRSQRLPEDYWRRLQAVADYFGKQGYVKERDETGWVVYKRRPQD